MGQQQGGYPGQQPSGYPGQQRVGYTVKQPGGYPGQQPGGYPGQQPSVYLLGEDGLVHMTRWFPPPSLLPQLPHPLKAVHQELIKLSIPGLLPWILTPVVP